MFPFILRTELKFELPPVPKHLYKNAILSGYTIGTEHTADGFSVHERADKLTSEADYAKALQEAKLIFEKKYPQSEETPVNQYYAVYAHTEARDMHARAGGQKYAPSTLHNRLHAPSKMTVERIKMVHSITDFVPIDSKACKLAKALSYYEQCGGSKPFYLTPEHT